MVTDSAQRGYYVVYLFRRDGSSVYLSLNQGTTAVLEQARSQYKQVLASRAAAYAGSLAPQKLKGLSLGPIDLGGGSTPLTPGYEAGNIAARFYRAGQLPEDGDLAENLGGMLKLYAELIGVRDTIEESEGPGHPGTPPSAREARRLRWHLRAEGRNSKAVREAKRHHGYRCQVCGFEFEPKYGEVGRHFIEAHHLTPFSELDERPTALDPAGDFAVLCSNCHSMIHRQVPPLTIEDLRSRIRTTQS
jgi:5-methylcytosine-specific restriction protein A